MTDVCRLEDDAQRYVVEVLSTQGPQDLDALVDNYIPPKPNDMADIKAGLRDGSAAVSNVDAKLWLIQEAIVEVNRVNDNYEVGDEEWIEEVISLDMYDPASHKYGQYRLAEGVDADKLMDRHGELLIRKSPLPDLFHPETGLWKDNSRVSPHSKIKELRQSMEATGWNPSLPAIADEHGVIIVGHGRLQVAKELGIEPVIVTRVFGDDPAGHAARTALAAASNVGASPLTAEDRRKHAEDLWGDGSRFTMTEIGKLLNVATKTISRDLSGLTSVKPPKERGGRPRKPKADPKPTPEPEPEPTPDPEPPTPTASPRGVGTDTADLHDRIKDVLADAASEGVGGAAPEPDDPKRGPDISVMLAAVAADLDKLTDHVRSLDTAARSRAFDEHIDRVSALARKVQRTVKVLTDAKSRPRGR